MSHAAAVRFLAAAADETRLRILAALDAAPDRELCVCELVDVLREPQYNVSRHLRILAGADLLAERREGRWVYYRIPKDRGAVGSVLRAAEAMGGRLDPESRARLRRRLALRRDGVCVVGVQDPALYPRRRGRG